MQGNAKFSPGLRHGVLFYDNWACPDLVDFGGKIIENPSRIERFAMSEGVVGFVPTLTISLSYFRSFY